MEYFRFQSRKSIRKENGRKVGAWRGGRVLRERRGGGVQGEERGKEEEGGNRLVGGGETAVEQGWFVKVWEIGRGEENSGWKESRESITKGGGEAKERE